MIRRLPAASAPAPHRAPSQFPHASAARRLAAVAATAADGGGGEPPDAGRRGEDGATEPRPGSAPESAWGAARSYALSPATFWAPQVSNLAVGIARTA